MLDLRRPSRPRRNSLNAELTDVQFLATGENGARRRLVLEVLTDALGDRFGQLVLIGLCAQFLFFSRIRDKRRLYEN